MPQRGSVFVLACDGTAHDLVAALRTFQWAARAFDSLEALLDELRAEVVDVLVVLGSGAGVAEWIAALRGAAPAAGLVWLDRGVAAVDARIVALNAGADLYAGAGTEAPEWDALLRNLCRRRFGGGSPWRVDARAGVLTGPAGELLPLTAAECAFFVQLLNAPGHRLRREELACTEGRDSLKGTRRVDVLVSRLRGKAQRLNIEFPVLAVRGWGYMLLPDGAQPRRPGATARRGCPGA
ncbi:helix-turn-helix domain-containing protein [Achromobacter sp. RTa]|uniref:helix-turn-helix domain-containing protein n=1 Tax=Achromobacter sp. RTa TaxID=1532557 RepID=UPI00068D8E9A|nr:helix-turn-helix domain-containing protein [Achromobacter sp. RTa]